MVIGVHGSELGEGQEQPGNVVLGAIVNEVEVLRVDGHPLQRAATPPTTMNRTSWRVRISISLRNRFSNSLHTFGKLMHLLECLQAFERGVTEASTHETSIHAVVVVLFARRSLVFEVCGHGLHLTRSGRPSSTRTSRPRRLVARGGRRRSAWARRGRRGDTPPEPCGGSGPQHGHRATRLAVPDIADVVRFAAASEGSGLTQALRRTVTKK